MEEVKQCKLCGFRKLLIVNELQESDQNYARPLHLCVGRSGHARAGKVRAVVCCRCGWIDWRAHELGAVLSMLGDLYPAVRVVDGDLTSAVEALGLSPSTGPGFTGWQFYAEGAYDDVAMVIGERVHVRATDRGPRNVMRLEIRARGRVELGSCAIRHPHALGLNPDVVYRQVVRTGDPPFDKQFTVVLLDPVGREVVAPAGEPEPPVVRIPWLDSMTRSKIAAASAEEVLSFGRDVSVILYEYNPETFTHAVDLAVHLARWSGSAEHPYR